MIKLLMTKRECAEALGVSLRTVDRMISEKKLPAVKVRRSVRIPIDGVLKLASIEQSTGGDLAQKPPVAQKGGSEKQVAGLKTQLPRSREPAAQKEVF